MKLSFTCAETENSGVVTDDLTWVCSESVKDLLALAHKKFALCGLRGLHVSNAIALPNNE